MSKLRQYLRDHDLSQAAFARRIGQSQQAVADYCTGTRVPRPKVMTRIFEVTEGAVTPNDFYELPAQEAGSAAGATGTEEPGAAATPGGNPEQEETQT